LTLHQDRGNAITEVKNPSAGLYEIDTSTDFASCGPSGAPAAVVATVNETSGVNTAEAGVNTNEIRVETFHGGAATDEPFSVTMTC
jgi:hypothetical protein